MKTTLKPRPRAPADSGAVPALVTRRQLAPLIGAHEITITKWQREGLPVAMRGRRGKAALYDVAKVRAWKQAREKAAQQRAPDFMASRSRKELAQAMEAEQRVATRAGLLIAVDDVRRIWSSEVASVRARMLAWPRAITVRVCRIATSEGEVGVERILRKAVEDVLSQLAGGGAKPATRRRRAAA